MKKLMALALVSLSTLSAHATSIDGKDCIAFPDAHSLTCVGDGMHGWGKAEGNFVIKKIESCKTIDDRKVCAGDNVMVIEDHTNVPNGERFIKLAGIVTTKLKTYGNGIWYYGYEIVNGQVTEKAVSSFALTKHEGSVPGVDSMKLGAKVRNTMGNEDVVVFHYDSPYGPLYGVKPAGGQDVIVHDESQFRFRFFEGPLQSHNLKKTIRVKNYESKDVERARESITTDLLSKELVSSCGSTFPSTMAKVVNLNFKVLDVTVEKVEGSWGGKFPTYFPGYYDHSVRVEGSYDCSFR